MSGDAFDVKEKVLDLEILYLLNLKPSKPRELGRFLLEIFELDLKETFISSRLDHLVFSDLIKKTKEETAGNEEALFSLTPRGAKSLDGGIQKLSQIALTMQLSLAQPLIIG